MHHRTRIHVTFLFLIFTFISAIPTAFAETHEEPHKDNKTTPAGGKVRIDASVTMSKWVIGTIGISRQSNTEFPSIFFPFLGPQVAAEYLFVPWFSLGAQYRGMFQLTPLFRSRPSHTSVHDIDAYAKFVLPSSTENDPGQVYFKIPGGYSLIVAEALSKMPMGFNVGVMLGGGYFFTPNVGMNAEVGYVYRVTVVDLSDLGNPGLKANIRTHEVAASVGIVVRI